MRKTREHGDLWPVWKVALEVDGDADASRLWVVEKTMRIGSAEMRFGGIAGVGTRPEHRLKGCASRVMEASTELMYDRGYEMGMLFGIRNFYHRFGYGVVFPTVRLVAQTQALLRAKPSLFARAMKKADAPGVRQLYNRLNAQRTGTVVRPRGWNRFELSEGFNRPGRTVLVEDTRGRLQGYAMWTRRDEQFFVNEIGGTGSRAFASLAVAVGRRARREKVAQVDFLLPAQDAFVDHCAAYGCVQHVDYTHNGGAMGRVIHLRAFMEKLAPELTRRLETVGVSLRESLRLETDIGSVGLRMSGSRVHVTGGGTMTVRLPQLLLTQLAMGYRRVADVADEPDVDMPKPALPLMEALFPRTDAYMWWSDRF